MTFTINNKSFILNGEEFFLHSAEMQYYRIKKENWQKHLAKIKEACCNTVTTYIPWDWHEYEEGTFDFTGKSAPERDLEGFLDLCAKNELYVVVKPGPYILAEYSGAGIPDWFMKRYQKECDVKTSQGVAGQADVISFFHPIYLDFAKKWYAQILPIIKKREISNNGNILMMQVCNEVGVFTWLFKQADYNPHCIKMYHDFLSNKYKKIDELNIIYKSKYKNFNEAAPPSDQTNSYNSKEDIAMDIDWHEFWRSYFAEYLLMLIDEIKKYGITLQFYHNLPGWIYGRGMEFPVNITMYNKLREHYPLIILGVDHIPENMSYRNIHDDMIINDIVWAQQGGRGPLFGAEFQAGSREYCSVTFPNELDLFYKASLANGLVGWNYYMFSQGKNPMHKGYFGPTFYWFTPLDHEANEGSLYPVVKKMGKFLNLFGKDISRMDKKPEICVLFYGRYYSTELAKNISRDKTDIVFDHAKIRMPAYFDGILKVLQYLNIDFRIVDIEAANNEELNKYKQVWMFSCDIMDEASQQKLVDYAQSGGNLVVYPYLPKYNLKMQSCNILRECINVTGEKLLTLYGPKVNIFNNEDIAGNNPIVIFDTKGNKGIEAIARTQSGDIAGFKAKAGKGNILVLGTYFGYSIEEHLKAYSDIISNMGVTDKNAKCDGNRLIVKQRFDKDLSMLFVGNYYNEVECDKIYYTHPVSKKVISLSLNGDKIILPPIYGFVTPINKKLAGDLNLLHTTSDIVDIELSNKIIKMKIIGNNLLSGEMAFSGVDIKNINNIKLGNKDLEIHKKDNYVYINYKHEAKELDIIINLI